MVFEITSRTVSYNQNREPVFAFNDEVRNIVGNDIEGIFAISYELSVDVHEAAAVDSAEFQTEIRVILVDIELGDVKTARIDLVVYRGLAEVF